MILLLHNYIRPSALIAVADLDAKPLFFVAEGVLVARYALTLGYTIREPRAVGMDRDLVAGEIYRVLSSRITDSQISYSRFLGEDAYKSITLGIKNLSGENAGTVCSIEFHLCHADRISKEIVTDFVISSITYRFP